MRVTAPDLRSIWRTRLYARLAEAARQQPLIGFDPVQSFLAAAMTSEVVEWRICSAVAQRVEALTEEWSLVDEWAHPVEELVRRLKVAARAERHLSLSDFYC